MAPDELEQVLAEAPVAFVPLGTYEHHGWHLPIGLDGIKARGLCWRVAQRIGGAVLPTFFYGTGGGHVGYKWTLMLSEAQIAPLIAVSLDHLAQQGFKVVVLLTGHYPPSVTVRNCRITFNSCRGFLLTTRRPVLIENNTFVKTTMPAILVANDANSWFESGPVHDLTIRGNRFIQCAEPVIHIAPENHTADPEQPVHRNIRILDNWFDLRGQNAVSARSTRGLVISGNRFPADAPRFHTHACTEVRIENNHFGVRE